MDKIPVLNKGYKFRLYPTEVQKVFFAKSFGCVRFIYNRMLRDRINFYKETGKSLNNTPAKYKQEFEWLKEVDSLALCNAQMNLNKAYTNFFNGSGFPRFKLECTIQVQHLKNSLLSAKISVTHKERQKSNELHTSYHT